MAGTYHIDLFTFQMVSVIGGRPRTRLADKQFQWVGEIHSVSLTSSGNPDNCTLITLLFVFSACSRLFLIRDTQPSAKGANAFERNEKSLYWTDRSTGCGQRREKQCIFPSTVRLTTSEIWLSNWNAQGVLSSNGCRRGMNKKAVSHTPELLVRGLFISAMILYDMKCLTKDTWRDRSLSASFSSSFCITISNALIVSMFLSLAVVLYSISFGLPSSGRSSCSWWLSDRCSENRQCSVELRLNILLFVVACSVFADMNSIEPSSKS